MLSKGVGSNALFIRVRVRVKVRICIDRDVSFACDFDPPINRHGANHMLCKGMQELFVSFKIKGHRS